jgi:hypothetical protein
VVEVPFNDINLIRTLNAYKGDDKNFAEAYCQYKECTVFAIFDERISLEIRKNG